LKAIPQYAKTEEVSRIIYSILKDKIDKAMVKAIALIPICTN
jgi:hypothetical protein